MQTTLRHYLSRGKVHPEVAKLMDKAVRGKRKGTTGAGKSRRR